MKNAIIIEIPADANLPTEVTEDTDYLRDALAAMLYKQGKISGVQARNMMAATRRAFEDKLIEFGVLIMDEKDFSDELEGARLLQSRTTQS